MCPNSFKSYSYFHRFFIKLLVFQELFYDPVKQRGYINSRLKTVQKNIRETTGERKQKIKTAKSNTGDEPKDIPQSFNIDALKDQFKDHIEFLKNCPNTETSAILERMKITYPMRRAILSSEQKFTIWDIFPCYLTSPEIVSIFFLYTHCRQSQ